MEIRLLVENSKLLPIYLTESGETEDTMGSVTDKAREEVETTVEGTRNKVDVLEVNQKNSNPRVE